MKAKFPINAGRPISGHSAFLQKRLAKGVSKIFFPLYICDILFLFFNNYIIITAKIF